METLNSRTRELMIKAGQVKQEGDKYYLTKYGIARFQAATEKVMNKEMDRLERDLLLALRRIEKRDGRYCWTQATLRKMVAEAEKKINKCGLVH